MNQRRVRPGWPPCLLSTGRARRPRTTRSPSFERIRQAHSDGNRLFTSGHPAPTKAMKGEQSSWTPTTSSPNASKAPESTSTRSPTDAWLTHRSRRRRPRGTAQTQPHADSVGLALLIALQQLDPAGRLEIANEATILCGSCRGFPARMRRLVGVLFSPSAIEPRQQRD